MLTPDVHEVPITHGEALLAMLDDLSPAQLDRLDGLRSRFPSTTFSVLDVDPFSRLMTIECEDVESFAYLAITADGLNVPDRIACGWASTRYCENA